MDLLPLVQVHIYRHVRGTAYKAALGHYHKPCMGLIVGTDAEWTRPTFTFALLGSVLQATDASDYQAGLQCLEKLLPAAHALASSIDQKILGVWVAWDMDWYSSPHARMGAVVDWARMMKIPYVMEVRTDGGESIWGLAVYFANRFPHAPFPYTMVKRRSHAANDNPRRIQARWRKQCREAIAVMEAER